MSNFSNSMKIQVLAYLTAKYEPSSINVTKEEIIEAIGVKTALFDDVVAKHRYMLNIEGDILDNVGTEDIAYNQFLEGMMKDKVKNLAIDIFMD